MATYTGLDGTTGTPLDLVAGGFTVSAGAVTLPINTILSAAVEENLTGYADVQMTNAQVLALRATPITLVAAPGANRTTVVERVHLVADGAAGAWTEPDVNNLAVEYGDGTDILVVEATGFIDQAGVEIRHQAPAEAVATPIANSVVRLFQVGAAEFGGGNVANTLSVRVWFRVADMIAFS